MYLIINTNKQLSGNNTNGSVSKPDVLKIDREAEHLKKGSASRLLSCQESGFRNKYGKKPHGCNTNRTVYYQQI